MVTQQATSLYLEILREAITWPVQMLQTETRGSLRFESRVPEMSEWCRTLEEAFQERSDLRIVVGFQKLSHLTPAIAARYERAVGQGCTVQVLGELDDPTLPARYPTLPVVPLTPDHPMAGEWFIVARGPGFATLFSAREKRRWPAQRTFVGIITDLDPLVEQALNLLEQEMGVLSRAPSYESPILDEPLPGGCAVIPLPSGF